MCNWFTSTKRSDFPYLWYKVHKLRVAPVSIAKYKGASRLLGITTTCFRTSKSMSASCPYHRLLCPRLPPAHRLPSPQLLICLALLAMLALFLSLRFSSHHAFSILYPSSPFSHRELAIVSLPLTVPDSSRPLWMLSPIYSKNLHPNHIINHSCHQFIHL